MYNELLKRHEEILKKLTEKASKETGFDERGQFINLQKMIYSEIGFINNIIDLIDKCKKVELKFKKSISKELAEKILDDYTKHQLNDGIFDSSKTLQEKYNKIIEIMTN